MNHKRFFSCISMFLIFILAGFGEWQKPVSAQSGEGPEGPLAAVRVEAGKLVWQPVVAADGWTLSVSGPGEWVESFVFGRDEAPVLAYQDGQGQTLADGLYRYELRPVLQAGEGNLLAAPAEAGTADGRAGERPAEQSKPPGAASVQGGTFRVQNGAFVLPSNAPEPAFTQPAAQLEPPAEPLLDVTYAEDVIVQGSLCVGFDCLVGEVFGYDTIRLKENNLQIAFDDTSMGTFPANDWAITTNDTASGGASYFTIRDVTASRIPFMIEAGAPTDALHVGYFGNIGLGTGNPQKKVHLLNQNTPAIRLDQDGSFYSPYIWDIAGNEANFFIRDVTAGDRLVFRIQPGAPTNSLGIRSNGNVGLGTYMPEYSLEVEESGADAVIVAQRTDGASAVVAAQANTVRIGALTNHNLALVVNNAPVMTLDGQGNATLSGVLYEHSDVNVKESFEPVDRGQVLDRLATLPITTWRYQSDEPGVRHMGPMAQDFHDAFGLGAGDTHIAALDVNGVTLAAAQELLALVEEQKAQVRQLEAENLALNERLDTLERLVSQALGTQTSQVLPLTSQGRASTRSCEIR